MSKSIFKSSYLYMAILWLIMVFVSPGWQLKLSCFLFVVSNLLYLVNNIKENRILAITEGFILGLVIVVILLNCISYMLMHPEETLKILSTF